MVVIQPSLLLQCCSDTSIFVPFFKKKMKPHIFRVGKERKWFDYDFLIIEKCFRGGREGWVGQRRLRETLSMKKS